MSSYNDRKIARQRRTKAYNFLVGKGLEPYKAAGVVGNLMQESYNYLDSDVVNRIGAVGIAQWLGPRKESLKKFAKQRGTSYKDFDTQLEFLYKELSTTYNGNEGGWSKRQKAAFDSATTVEEAADMFVLHFERPGKHERHMDKRRKYASQVFLENNDPNIYAKDKKGEIVNINPEEATPKQIQESEFVKHEFYEQEYFKIREEKAKRDEVLNAAVKSARKALQDLNNEKNFIKSFNFGSSNQEGEVEENEEVEGTPVKEGAAKELESQIFGSQGTPTQTPNRGFDPNLYPDLTLPENEFYNLLLPEGFKHGGKVKEGTSIRDILGVYNDGGKTPPEKKVDNTFVAVTPQIDPEKFREMQMGKLQSPIESPYDISRIQDPEKVSQEEVTTMLNNMRGFARTMEPLDVDPDLSRFGFDTNRDLKAEEFGVKDPILKEKINKDKNLAAKKNVSSYINDTLRQGDRGDQVKLLQIYLVSNGYLNEDVNEVDGIFGKKTAAAVKQYQKDNNLKSDAVVGKNTKQAMSGLATHTGSLKDMLKAKSEEIALTEAIEEGYEDMKDMEGIPSKKDLLTQAKQGAVPLFARQFLKSSLLMKPKGVEGEDYIEGPMRKLARVIFGEGNAPITEEDLNDKELSKIKQVVAAKINEGGNKVSYNDWRKFSDSKREQVDSRDSGIDYFDPAYSLRMTLGTASIVNEDGHIYVVDEYDFNDAENKDKRYKNEYTNEKGLLPLSESKGVGNFLYRAARNYKTEFGRASGGSPSRIYLGTQDDLLKSNP